MSGAVMTWSIAVGWVVFGVLFLALKPRGSGLAEPGTRRDRSSWLAIAAQGLALGLVWGVRRHPITPVVTGAPALDAVVAAAVPVLVIASTCFDLAALRTLGRQWSLTARLRDDHRLVTAGPYAIVRHPIYTGLGGMLLATGLALSRLEVVPVAAVLYYAATRWRIDREERLLARRFGAIHADYVARVPALIPQPWRWTGRA